MMKSAAFHEGFPPKVSSFVTANYKSTGLMTTAITDEIPPPWRLTDTGSAFKIADARGRGVAWVYYRREDALKKEYLTRDQAVEWRRPLPAFRGPRARADEKPPRWKSQGPRTYLSAERYWLGGLGASLLPVQPPSLSHWP